MLYITYANVNPHAPSPHHHPPTHPPPQASKAVVDIPSPDLSSPDGAAQWEAVVAALILSTASLVKYLVGECGGVHVCVEKTKRSPPRQRRSYLRVCVCVRVCD